MSLTGTFALAVICAAPSSLKTRSSTQAEVLEALGSAFGKDGPFRLSGFMQFDYLRLERSSDQLSDGTGQPLNEDRFMIRRGRLRLEADWPYIGFAAETELSTADGAQIGARELIGFLQYPHEKARLHVRLVAGLFPVPFGYEMHIQTNTQRFFGERTLMSRAFVPGRFDLGLGINGRYRWLEWSLAVQNGEPLGARAFPSADPNGAKDFAGRVGGTIELGSYVRLSGGISGLKGTGFSPGKPPTKDTFIWRDFNEDGQVSSSELQSVKGSAATPSENFDRWGLGADLQLMFDIPVLGPLMLSAEGALGVNLDRGVSVADPRLLGRDQRSRGFYAQLVQELFGFGTIGLRYDFYEPTVDNTDLQGGQTVIARRPFRTFTFGAGGHYRFGRWLRARALVEYELQQNSLGRDETGRPAPLSNDTLRLRLEIMF